MRLSKPGIFYRGNDAGSRESAAIARSIWTFRTVTALIAIVILFFVIRTIEHKRNDTVNKYKSAPSAVDSSISFLKDSKNLNDMRSLASDYAAKQDYVKAVELAQQIANQTKETKDYMSLLTMCAAHAIPNQQQCLDSAVANLKPKLNSLSFYEAYIIASALDDAKKNNKDAAIFYQKAYDTYDATRADPYMKTKDQIKQRISQLNA